MSDPPAPADELPPVGSSMLATARELSFPRRAGGSGDARARDWLLARLSAAGFEPVERRFRMLWSRPLALLRTGLRMLSLAIALTALTASLWGWPALGVLLVLGAIAVHDLRRALLDDEPYQLDEPEAELESQNVLVRLGASTTLRRAVLIAHLDSKSQTVSLPVRVGLVVVALVGTLSLPFCLRIEAPLWTLVGPLSAALALRLLAHLDFGDDSPGALDNAGSVAVVMATLERLAADPPAGCEVIGVFTGAEELCMAGARVLARDRAAVWKGGETVVINLDGVGATGPVGISGPTRTVRWARAHAAAAGLTLRRGLLPFGVATDALPLSRAGLEVATLTSAQPGRAVRRIHTRRDLPDALDPAALAAAARIAEVLVRAHAARP